MEELSKIPGEPQPEPAVSSNGAHIAVQVIAGIAGAAISQYLGLQATIMVAAGGAAGALCGLLPYSVAKKGNKLRAARISMWTCVAAGLVLGIILALPVALVATVVVLATGKADTVAAVEGQPSPLTIEPR